MEYGNNLMAIYHFSCTMITRSKGQPGVSASAYRAAEKIADARTGTTHNFIKNKSDLIHQNIHLPEQAPAWLSHRAKLWNAAERVEKRKDAQLAREFVFALPLELSPDQNITLATEFVQGVFVSLGMIADLCIHSGHEGAEQPHAHVMLTTRLLTAEGFGLKELIWGHKRFLFAWRKDWADYCNGALEKHGHDVRIDHRSLKAQGMELEPQGKIGPPSSPFYQARALEHQQIAQRNGERLLKDPSIAFKSLPQGQSRFPDQDLVKFARRHSVTDEQFEAVYRAIKNHDAFVPEPSEEEG